MDQAKELRNLINKGQNLNLKNNLNSRVITISSGKGGVGKSSFSVNLAIYLASLKKRVLIIDADFGLANIEVLLGIRPKYNFYSMIKGEKNISEIVTETDYNIKFISGGNGLRELSTINSAEIRYFIEQFEYLDKIADIIIIDTGAGIAPSVTSFLMASDENIIVTTPEPTSFTDAYTLIKIIKEQNKNIDKINVVINKADDKYEADRTIAKISYVCSKFLGVNVKNIGHIPLDTASIKAIKQQRPAILSFPESDYSRAIKSIGDVLLDKSPVDNNTGIKSFMQKLVHIFNR
ncbi:MinD/ParA family protein [uncultured Tyzzerella sp.]|uniref:MinD/ParA family protein n=1 Tax=uncultured Tyzzerella sp. TaxID=2321398 RepID=UPI002943D8D3|nr:MinD/ParA family protein [uncultured Tyzzerella sp.]